MFPFYKKSEGIAGKITKKHLGLDDNIKIADDLFSIQDSGDYELDYGIRDKTKYLSKFISYNSIIDNNNFLYNSVPYSNFKDLSRYARERVKQSINLKGKENTFDAFEEVEERLDENLELDFEWKDLLLEPEKNLDKRLKSLRFDDLINIVSGKISDLELHHKLNDKRPVKTAKDMDDFLMDLVLEAEVKKDRRIKEKEQKRKKDEQMKKQFKDGFGTLLLLGVNQKSDEEEIVDLYKKLDHHQYQKLFNQFLLNNNMQPKSISDDTRDQRNQDNE